MVSYTRHSKTRKTRKTEPWVGWGKLAPKGAQRTRMYKSAEKYFLGTKTKGDKKHPNFPICAKNTCKVDKKGFWAAYLRGKQWGGESLESLTSPMEKW